MAFRTAFLAGIAAAVSAGASAHAFEITSRDFTDGGRLQTAQVGVGANCRGGNVSPALAWKGAPPGTRSFALTMFDPDAHGGVWHWAVFGIPAGTSGLPAHAGASDASLPKGARHAVNTHGKRAYSGACPPAGPPHRYIITLYALKTARPAGIGTEPEAAALDAAASREAIGKARITGIYGK